MSELISLKFKAARTAVAHTVLDDVSFDACPGVPALRLR